MDQYTNVIISNKCMNAKYKLDKYASFLPLPSLPYPSLSFCHVFYKSVCLPYMYYSCVPRELTQDDFSALCVNIEQLLVLPDKSADCSTLLRQLYAAMQTNLSGSTLCPR